MSWTVPRRGPLAEERHHKIGEPPPASSSEAAAKARWRELTRRVQKSSNQNTRPRDAATLLVLDWSRGEPKLLMGQRHHDMKFMPGKFVFPGGRVEPQDYLASVGCTMPEPMKQKLLKGISRRPHRQHAYAFAHAALRETQEETGIVIGTGANLSASKDSPRPDFSGFSYLARAITPARTNRRFDTRFFVVPANRITSINPIVDGEFTAVKWFTLAEARRQDLPSITRIILQDLDERIAEGTLDDPEVAVPFYFMRGACFHRKLI